LIIDSDGSREISVGLVEPPFGAAIFNFHADFGQKVENYHVTTLRLPQTNPLSGNVLSDPD
jgi:hypothetical protein